ncbi:MAG TPA: cell division protein ZapB [Treponemataceae bacterium]|nr:cell division protein ZapB [Treponemataceae bacterium]
MLSLDQVRLLENRVEKAVERIQSLTSENTHLRTQLTPLQSRVNELEGLVRAFKDDQGRIEEGILNALDRLSAFEDSVYTSTIPSNEETELMTETENEEIETIDEEIEILSEAIEEETEINENIPEIDSIEIENTEKESTMDLDGQMDIF